MEPAKKKQKVSTTSIFIPHDCWEIILDFLCGTQAVHKDMFQAVIREMDEEFGRGFRRWKTWISVKTWRQRKLYHQRRWEAVCRAEWQDRFLEVVQDLNYLFEGGVLVYDIHDGVWGGVLTLFWIRWGDEPGWRGILRHRH